VAPVPFILNRPHPDRVEWSCSAAGCTAAAVTGPASTKVPWHPCPGTGGAVVPLIRAGERARVVLTPREDYVAGELVQRAPDGRVLGAAQVQRWDGSNDVIVFAPTATAAAAEVKELAHDG